MRLPTDEYAYLLSQFVASRAQQLYVVFATLNDVKVETRGLVSAQFFYHEMSEHSKEELRQKINMILTNPVGGMTPQLLYTNHSLGKKGAPVFDQLPDDAYALLGFFIKTVHACGYIASKRYPTLELLRGVYNT